MSKQRFGVELPGTLQRSPDMAQRTFAKTLRSAEREYGRGERASRTALASLKHGFEKVGDHWEPKEHKGPSDPRETLGGVDVLGHSRRALYARARELVIAGRSTVSKEELARAIAKKQR
jgi:hypothetical protein